MRRPPLGQLVHPTIHAQAEQQDHIGALHETGHVGCRIFVVRIAAGRHEAAHLAVRAGDLPGKVIQRKEARHDERPEGRRLGLLAAGEQERHRQRAY